MLSNPIPVCPEIRFTSNPIPLSVYSKYNIPSSSCKSIVTFEAAACRNVLFADNTVDHHFDIVIETLIFEISSKIHLKIIGLPHPFYECLYRIF